MKSISTVTTSMLFAAAFLLESSHVLANSIGSSTCAAGQSIASGHGGTGKTFAESNLVLKWGGDEFDPSATNTIRAATDHPLTLTTDNGSKFKGFLLRLSGKNGATASSTTFVAVDSSSSQVSDLCTSDVIGITHTDAKGKSSVAFTLNHPEAAEMLLEVTVVTKNQISWAYAAFDLNISADDTATASPTVTPTQTSGSSAVLGGVSNVMIVAGAFFLSSFALM